MTLATSRSEARAQPGAGSVDVRAGRYRARLTLADGRRARLGTFDTEEEARRALAIAADELLGQDAAPVGGVTLIAYGRGWLKKRELSRQYRDIENIRGVFEKHIAPAPFAARALATLRRPEVRAWVEALKRRRVKFKFAHRNNGKTLSLDTVQKVFNVLRTILKEAVADELIETSPAEGVQVKTGREGRVDDPWTYLTPAEQDALWTCEAISEADRLVIFAAIYTGVRASELAELLLEDVHLDGDSPHVTIKRSRKGKPTKSGKARRVPLIERAVGVFRRWLEILPTYAPDNEKRLAFPTARGGKRSVGHLLGSEYTGGKRSGDKWKAHLRAVGITRNVRWHDLRHTAGSSLVAGWWGRAWRLEEVRGFLGHGTIAMTERYAHLGDDELKRAASATRDAAPPVSPEVSPRRPPRGPRPSDPSPESPMISGAPPARLERATFALGKRPTPERDQEVGPQRVASGVATPDPATAEKVRALLSELQAVLGEGQGRARAPTVWERLLSREDEVLDEGEP